VAEHEAKYDAVNVAVVVGGAGDTEYPMYVTWSDASSPAWQAPTLPSVNAMRLEQAEESYVEKEKWVELTTRKVAQVVSVRPKHWLMMK